MSSMGGRGQRLQGGAGPPQMGVTVSGTSPSAVWEVTLDQDSDIRLDIAVEDESQTKDHGGWTIEMSADRKFGMDVASKIGGGFDKTTTKFVDVRPQRELIKGWRGRSAVGLPVDDLPIRARFRIARKGVPGWSEWSEEFALKGEPGSYTAEFVAH